MQKVASYYSKSQFVITPSTKLQSHEAGVNISVSLFSHFLFFFGGGGSNSSHKIEPILFIQQKNYSAKTQVKLSKEKRVSVQAKKGR
jgi:hypothetical protein